MSWAFEESKEETVSADVNTMNKEHKTHETIAKETATLLPLLMGPLDVYRADMASLQEAASKYPATQCGKLVSLLTLAEIVMKPKGKTNPASEIENALSFCSRAFGIKKKDLPDALILRVDAHSMTDVFGASPTAVKG
jgi:hypothetical protein